MKVLFCVLDITTSLVSVNFYILIYSSWFCYHFIQKERLEREMEIKRVREELLAQAKQKDSFA